MNFHLNWLHQYNVQMNIVMASFHFRYHHTESVRLFVVPMKKRIENKRKIEENRNGSEISLSHSNKFIFTSGAYNSNKCLLSEKSL